MNLNNILNNDFLKMFPVEFFSSLIVMTLVCIFSIVVYFKQKKYSPLDQPKGIVNVAEMIVEFADEKVSDLMHCPRYFSNFGAYVTCLFSFIFFGFVLGMMGLPVLFFVGPKSEGYVWSESKLFTQLPNPFTNLAFTLTIGLLTVIMIEITKLRTQKFSYWKQFVFTFPPLLPLITNFTPMLSLGIRLFGNSFAGYCIMTLIYGAMNGIANGFGLVASPLIMPFLHAYFDLFSGFIQALVFTMITMMDLAQEAPEEDYLETQAKAISLKAQM